MFSSCSYSVLVASTMRLEDRFLELLCIISNLCLQDAKLGLTRKLAKTTRL